MFQRIKNSLKATVSRIIHDPIVATCPVCHGESVFVDAKDFNQSCEDRNGLRMEPSGILIDYFQCTRCGFTHAPEMAAWSHDQFKTYVYNDDYCIVDPDYKSYRAHNNARLLTQSLSALMQGRTHLDYGGGEGLLSSLLNKAGWNSRSHDPFANPNDVNSSPAPADLVTAFEVFEHVPNPRNLMREISRVIKQDGVLVFSTLLSDGHVSPDKPLDWWYAAPRNGHISLHTQQSLQYLASLHQLQFGSYDAGLHAFWRSTGWAASILPESNKRNT